MEPFGYEAVEFHRATNASEKLALSTIRVKI